MLVGDVSGHGADALEATNPVRSQLQGLLDAGLSPRVVALAPGSVACFYTDGLVEAKSGEGMLGRALLEVTIADRLGRARVSVDDTAAPHAPV